MDQKELEKKIKKATELVKITIVKNTDQGSNYSRGLAYEGYLGGYLDCLNDVLAVMMDVPPSNRGYGTWWNM